VAGTFGRKNVETDFRARSAWLPSLAWASQVGSLTSFVAGIFYFSSLAFFLPDILLSDGVN